MIGRVCLPRTFRANSPKFHSDIYKEYLDENQKKICVVAPRGHGKTTTVGKIIPLHHIFYGGNNRVIAIVSRTQAHSIRTLTAIKKYLANKRIMAIFGDWTENTAIKWTATEVCLKNGTSIYAIGAGQQIRGVLTEDYRITLLLADDLEDKENTRTKESVDNNFDWFIGEACNALDPLEGRAMLIGTVIVHGCIVEMVKDMEDWKTLWYQAVHNVDDPNDRRVLWPEWYSYEKLMAEKRSLEKKGKGYIWFREFQNEIRTDSESMVTRDEIVFVKDIRVYQRLQSSAYSLIDVTKMDGSTEKNVPVYMFMGVDPASSIENWADYSTIFTIARDEKRVFCIDLYRNKVKPMTLADNIMIKYRTYWHDGANIETVQYQEMLRDYMLTMVDRIPGLERRNNPRTEKNERLRSLQPWFSRRIVYIPVQGFEAFVDELLRYPMGKHDDTLDGFFYALKNSYPCFEKHVEKQEEKSYFWKKRKHNWVTGV